MQKSLPELLSEVRAAHEELGAAAGPLKNKVGMAAARLLTAAVALGDHAVALERRHRLLGQCDAYRSLMVATQLDYMTVATLLGAAATSLVDEVEEPKADAKRSA